MPAFEIQVAIISVLAFILVIISYLAYRKARLRRLLVTFMVFVLFLVKGIIMSISVFTDLLKDVASNPSFHVTMDLIILLFLFVAVLSPPRSKAQSQNAEKVQDDVKRESNSGP